jgi:N-acetyl-gamma-glutamyl-phosphate reductase
LKTTVGILGATGYTGQELRRLVLRHPSLEISFTTGTGGGHVPHEAAREREAGAYFLCLPHGVSGRYAAELRERFPEATLIDLSADLRFGSAEGYRTWYAAEPPAPGLVGRAPYGLTEVFRERIRGARLVSNPGCYATSMLLPLVPLLREGLVEADDIVVDAKSGASGAGRTLREGLLFCEVAEEFEPYSPGRTHRHIGEVEAALEESTGRTASITFCPHLLPVKRGIQSALYLRARAGKDRLRQAIEAFYDDSPFVKVVEGPPRLADVVRTNLCHISLHEGTPGRIVVFSALDNLVKGAAGQAVQNLNVALGWDETLGLREGLS